MYDPRKDEDRDRYTEGLSLYDGLWGIPLAIAVAAIVISLVAIFR